jgi:hypothetical protein
VNECEGSLYNIVREKRVTKIRSQVLAEEKVGGRIFSDWIT